LEYFLHGHHFTRFGVREFRERVVIERLLNLDGLAGIDELVDIRGHRVKKDIVDPMQVRSAVIPAAGLGTRFLPATKAVPKELFPIGDRPAIQIVIDEALGAGIDHIVVVSSRSKPAIDAYFAPDPALLDALEAKGKTDTAERLRSIGRDWRVSVVYQDNPKGLGHAIGCAREAVGNEPFAVLLPDELMSSSSVLAQMNGVCASTGGSVVAVVEVPHERVGSYGVIDPAGELSADGVIAVKDLVEKPSPDDAPSDYILTGRYVLTADAWAEIEALQPGAGGELQLTDALRAQALRSPFHAVVADESRLDTGTPLGFLTASIELGLQNPEMSAPLKDFLANIVR
jgi:UTP--glucose-1-phosphate uridylyltransferase